VSEVRHEGRLVAAISHDRALLSDPALLAAGTAMAGVVLDNQRLGAEADAAVGELRRSRARIAATAEQERRRIERDLHDGAQQRLVALRIELGLAGGLVHSDPDEAASFLHRLEHEVDQALEDLRSLAHGVYPPLLADRGLVEALRAAAMRMRLPVQFKTSGVGRYAPEVESAVYFCLLEALQNVLKHAAGARRVVIQLEAGSERVRFSVRDDGSGAPGGTIRPGAGVTNMHDRLAAVGGEVQVVSTPNVGTLVRGHVPTAGPYATTGPGT
jgi:signal transduction histidine kinase